MASPPDAVAAQTVARLGRAMLDHLDDVTDRLVAAILAEDEAYAGSVPIEDLRSSCRENLARVLQGLVAGGTTQGLLDAPVATAVRRADQGVPLESVLHAYRVGGRVIWDGMVALARHDPDVPLEAVLVAASAVWDLVDRFSSTVADAYRRTEFDRLRQDERRRDAVLAALLDGRGGDPALASAAVELLDLPADPPYAVVAGPLGDGEADRHVEPLCWPQQALEARGVRSAWTMHGGHQVGLLAGTRSALVSVDGLLTPCARGPVGVSAPVDDLARVGAALRQARLAAQLAEPGGPPVVMLRARLVDAVVTSAPELTSLLVEDQIGELLRLPGEEAEVLLDTVSTWLDTGMSAGRSAQRLHCHRNTVLNRLRRVVAVSGHRLDGPEELARWWMALSAWRVAHRGGRPVTPPAGPSAASASASGAGGS
ncbi:MAG TPA: helix-turn-helix domain-containing protein [Mycobacteriales bacterium]|nr:helix-turn-helix domain-containing protein [Mycobacteriales bacterium]